MPDPKKLQIRIVVPFVFLFAGVTLGSLLLERHYISGIMDERIGRQVERVARVLARSEFVLNPAYIYKLKEILDGEVLVFDRSGKVVVSTLPGATHAILEEYLKPREIFLSLEREGGLLRRTVEAKGTSYLLVSRRLELSGSSRDLALAIISPLSDVAYAKARILYRLFFIGMLGIFFVTIVGFFISRSVTRPVEDLVTVTEEVADGHFDKKAALPGIEELRRLACSINAMGDKMKRYEEDLVRSSELAAAGRIAGAVAHEVRNPLSSIKMMVQLLRNRVSDGPDNHKVIRALLEEIGRLERTVSELTDRVRPSDVVMRLEDLNTVFEEVFEVIGPKLTHRKISLAKNMETPLPLVNMDRDKIKQVIWNLILNAVDSMPVGGTTKVTTRHNVTANTIEGMVEDEGVGMTEDVLNKLFIPFSSAKPGGLGLGLATSKRIVEGHGGLLKIENRADGGVRAAFVLPLA
jgi:signal transduction histidine kinase